MNRDKLTELINDENERSERDLADEARGIIRQITQEQGKIRSANKRISGVADGACRTVGGDAWTQPTCWEVSNGNYR